MGQHTYSQINRIAQDVSRGPSSGIWGDYVTDLDGRCAQGDYGYPPSMEFYDEFNNFPGKFTTNAENAMGQWSVFVANNSSAKIGTGPDTTNLPQEGGVIALGVGANNNLSISMCPAAGGFRMMSPASGFALGQKLWFEARVAIGSIAAGAQDFFVGLMDTGDGGTRIASAADLVFSADDTIKTASGNGACLGFWKRSTTNPSDFCVVYNVNNGTAQRPGSGTTLQKLSLNSGVAAALTVMSSTNNIAAAGVWIKLGFLFDPAPLNSLPATAAIGNQTVGSVYKPVVTFFVNGQALPWFLSPGEVQAAGPLFPTGFLAPVIAFRSGGTAVAAGAGYVDWIRVAQIGSF